MIDRLTYSDYSPKILEIVKEAGGEIGLLPLHEKVQTMLNRKRHSVWGYLTKMVIAGDLVKQHNPIKGTTFQLVQKAK